MNGRTAERSYMQTEAELERDLVRIFRQDRERAHSDISQPDNPNIDHLHLTLLSGIRGASWRGHFVCGLETNLEALGVRLKKQTPSIEISLDAADTSVRATFPIKSVWEQR